MSPADLRALIEAAEWHAGETTERYIARAIAEARLANWRAWLPGLLEQLERVPA